MIDLSLRDLRATQAVVRELLDCSDPEQVIDRGLEALYELVPSEFSAVTWVNPVSGTILVRSWPADAVPAVLECAPEAIAAHPLVAAGLSTSNLGPLRISDVLGDRQWRNHPARWHLREIAGRRAGTALERQVGTSTLRDGFLVAVTINRTGSEFDDRERKLTGILAHAIGRTHQLLEHRVAVSAMLDVADRAAGPLVVIDRIGRPIAGTPGGTDLYKRLCRAGSEPRGQPSLPRSGEELISPLPASYRLLRLQSESTLTPREVEVLDLASHGATAQAIARRLGKSPRTVDKQLERAYKKLGATDRASAVRVALVGGLLPRHSRLH